VFSSVEKYSESLGAVFNIPLPQEAQWGFKDETIQADKKKGIYPKGSAVSREVQGIPTWLDPGTSTMCAPDLQLVRENYILKDYRGVSEFLETYPFLVPLLTEVFIKIQHYFEPYPQVFLDVIKEPEFPNDVRLAVFIRTNLSPEDALKKLDRLDQDWWLEAMIEAHGKLYIHLEFI
jgi:hypothetical protein